MLDFREISISDKDLIDRCLKVSDFQGCEYSFANNLAWRRLADTVIAFYDDFYISCSFYDGEPCFTFPAGASTDDNQGKQKYIQLFSMLEDLVRKQGHKLVISSVTKNNLTWMSDFYGDRIDIVGNESGYDYIYNSEDLAFFKGRKYHGKRNHVNRFKENKWSFRLMTDKDFDECTHFAAESYNNLDDADFSAAVEQYALHVFFSNFDRLGLVGGMLFSNDELVGFTIGEPLNSNTFDVHIEKARADVQGAYPTLCSEFIKACGLDFKYINREEDLGLDGLRKSKLSYRPTYLLEKYKVSFK